MKRYLIILFFILLSFISYSQKDSLSRLTELSIEDLMKVSIYSSSKSDEPTFEANLSSSVVTKEQINRAGCTSIMDALRLVPGIIVREQTNGNYDIHLRGLGNVPPNSTLIFFANSTTLVMIDNRPVYNYLRGGTFWETLPIDLNDVERIEVVRGPTSTLYGPNAVSGVINIITTKPEKKGLYQTSNVQYGSYNSLIANTSYGYKFNEKVSTHISGNFQRRYRTQTSYYDVIKNMYVDPIDSVTAVQDLPPGSVKERYPHPDLAMNKYGFNAFVNYTPKGEDLPAGKELEFSLAMGIQNSEVQKEFGFDPFGYYLPDISTATSETKYADLKGTIRALSFQFSELNGTESPMKGATPWKWDFNTFDATVEYTITAKNLQIRPGINYRHAWYDYTKYVSEEITKGFRGRVRSLTSAGSLRADYKAFHQKFRMIAAGRVDKFNYPTKAYFSYEFAALYKINEFNVIRAVQSKAYRAPVIFDIYSDFFFPSAFGPGANVDVTGNKNIRLLSSEMTEVGYRGKVGNHLEIEIEAFRTLTKDFSDLVVESGSSGANGFTFNYDINNLPVSAVQLGATLSVNYINQKWQIRPFVSLQKTTLRDYSPHLNSTNAPPLPSNNNDPEHYNLYSGLGTKTEHAGTPTWYGGAYINWQVNRCLNINLNPYFFSDQTQLQNTNLTYQDGVRGVEHIKGRLIMNAAISYEIAKRLTASVNFRNLFNNTNKEFYRADSPSLMVFGSASFKF